MVTEQDTLIYIENEDRHDASVAANAFAHKDIKNRAYVNTLGADLALKYLASENIDVSNIHNIHSIKKILEEIDISDIMLPNIHIDVRVVFDENAIFIPKSHFEYNLVPDIYLVLNLAKDFSHVKFLGFFEPKLINKNNANEKYYFIEKEKLSSVRDLKHYIESFKGNTSEKLSEEELTNSERIIISMADNDISENDKKYLIQQLTKSAELRDKFLEYENFETLSYKAMTDPHIDRKNIEEKLSANQIDNLTETNTQEAINNLDDIENLISGQENQNPEKEHSNTTSNNMLSDIADITETVIGGAAAIAGAQAAGELLNTIDDSINLADTTLNVADAAINLADTALDFTELETDKKDSSDNKINTEENEPISFDNIDTSALDNAIAPEEAIEEEEEEAISLNNIETPENIVNTDFIDSIDNKISFDNIPTTPDIINDSTPLDIDEEKISLDDINPSDINQITPESNFESDTISFDDIDTTNIANINNSSIDNNDNMISFDNISKEQNYNNTENYQEETISFDTLNKDKENDEQENSSSDENKEEEKDIQNNETNDFLDDTLNFDDIENNNQESPTSIDITENFDNNTDITLDDIPDINDINDINDVNEINNIQDTKATSQELEEEPEIVEDENITHNTESFGKNLLENLSSENIDDISIENLELNNNDIPLTNAEEISSNDLLSQIDDVLASNNATANNEEETTIENSNNNNNEDFDSIPDIEDLSDETLLNETISSETENTPQDKTDEPIEETIDTALDELLNNTEDEQTNETETDNIGVLFNDTDPVTDAELDNMEEFNSETNYAEENQMQHIPGAALYNKKTKNNKSVILVAAALITVIAAASAIMIFKPKGDSGTNDIEPIAAQSSGDETAENILTDTSSTDSNVLATNAPDIKNNIPKDKANAKAQPAKELKNTALKPKQNKTSAYMDVSKLVWDVPNTLSYSPKIQNYLRTAGKSIKLSLSADLLLATEYAYTNQVKVSLKLSKDGNIIESNIASSSGSTQIDNIVLQSVKDTLSVVKPPSSEIKTPDFNLSLIIYF